MTATRQRLPDELLELIRHGAGTDDRSAVFHSVIAQLKKRRWGVDAIVALLEKYPRRHRAEILRPPPRGSAAFLRQIHDQHRIRHQ